MRPFLAIAELRLRGANSARLVWLLPVAFAGGAACAAWAPGTAERARAAAADGIALSLAAVAALLAVLVIAATAFASEVRTTAAHALLATPVSRAKLVAGGMAGQAAFGLLLALGLAASATLGLDAGGLGARARGAVRPVEPLRIDDTFRLGASSPEVRIAFTAPADHRPGEPLHVRFSPRGQVETDFSPAGALLASAGPPGLAGRARRIEYRAGVPFRAEIDAEGVLPGAPAEIVLRHASGGRRLLFVPGSVEIAGASERFAWNVVKAVLCLAPLLALAACAGAAASARLGAAASVALVLFLLLLVAGRPVLLDAAHFVVEAAEMEAEAHAEGGSGHAEHDHHVDVTPAQVVLARGAIAGLALVPDADSFWRFGDLADGRAVTPADLLRAFRDGLAPCLALLAASWLLVRRRELLPE